MSMIGVSIVFSCNGCPSCLVATADDPSFTQRIESEWFIGFDRDFCPDCRHKAQYQAEIKSQARSFEGLHKIRLMARIRAAIPQLNSQPATRRTSQLKEVRHAA